MKLPEGIAFYLILKGEVAIKYKSLAYLKPRHYG